MEFIQDTLEENEGNYCYDFRQSLYVDTGS